MKCVIKEDTYKNCIFNHYLPTWPENSARIINNIKSCNMHCGHRMINTRIKMRYIYALVMYSTYRHIRRHNICCVFAYLECS